MAQKAHDQAGPDAQCFLGIHDRAMETIDHGGELDASGRVALRIEEHFDVHEIVRARPLQIAPGEIIEILFRDQHGHPLIIDVEKILQVRKLIGLAQRLDRRVGQRNAIAARQRKHQLGLEAALDVNVHLAFGQTRDQGVNHQHCTAYCCQAWRPAGRTAKAYIMPVVTAICRRCHSPTMSRAPPSSLTLSLPPANNISSSASLMSNNSTVVPPPRAMLACAIRRISSLMNAALTPLVRRAASPTTASLRGRPLP